MSKPEELRARLDRVWVEGRDPDVLLAIARDALTEVERLATRVKQVEAQLAVARKALDILEAAPTDTTDPANIGGLLDALDDAHNLLDDALEWLSPKAQALLDMAGAVAFYLEHPPKTAQEDHDMMMLFAEYHDRWNK